MKKNNLEVGCYKIDDGVNIPRFSTEQAACFDVEAFLPCGQVVKYYNKENEKLEEVVDSNESIFIAPSFRALIPTGLIFDIPEGYSIRLHPRSGNSIKKGVGLVNSEGVIDSDYYHQTFISLINYSDKNFIIQNGDRIAQGELVENLSFEIKTISKPPEQRTDRTGGFGSTG